MSNNEIKGWLEMLSLKPTEQVRLIKDMLRHAQGDGMSNEDRNICLKVLQGLDYPAYKAIQMGQDAKDAKVSAQLVAYYRRYQGLRWGQAHDKVQAMGRDERYKQVAKFFKVSIHPQERKILYALAQEKRPQNDRVYATKA